MSFVLRIAFTLIFLTATINSWSQDYGGLDTTFGDSGIVKTLGRVAWGHFALDIAVQEDGKILAGGSLLAVRYLSNGKIDSSFANNGLFVLPQSMNEANPRTKRIFCLNDGKILLAGESSDTKDFLLVRLLPDGRIDATFGNNGVGRGTFAFHGHAAMQADGKIVFAGYQSILEKAVIVRFNTNGQLDSAFGNNGCIYAESHDDQKLQPDGLAVTDDGRIAVSVFGIDKASNLSIGILCYTESGKPDSSFNGYGYLKFKLQSSGGISDPVPLPDGKMLVAGAMDGKAFVTLLKKNGSTDSSYGKDGKASIQNKGLVSKFMLTPNGKIIASTDFNWSMVRIWYNGSSADTSYGNQGFLSTAIKNCNRGETKAFALAQQPDRKIIMGGCIFDTTTRQYYFALARYLENGKQEDNTTPDTPFIIYPNPVRNLMTIKLFHPFGTDYTVGITSMDGRLVKQLTCINNKEIVDLEYLPAGIYTVTIRLANLQFSQPISKF